MNAHASVWLLFSYAQSVEENVVDSVAPSSPASPAEEDDGVTVIVLLVVAVVASGVGAFALMNRGGDTKDEKLLNLFDNPMAAAGDEEDDGED